MPTKPEINFDPVAPIYDSALKACFGNRLESFESEIFQSLGSFSGKALIIGGGSGRTLRLLSSRFPAAHVHHHELSEKMNALARKKGGYNVHKTTFSTDRSAVERDAPYDLICLPFVVDCYPSNQVAALLNDVHHWLRADGRLLILDFASDVNSRNRTSLMRRSFIQSLYWFFTLFAGLKTQSLPEISKLTRSAGFTAEWLRTSSDEWFEAGYWKLESSMAPTA